MYSSARPFTPQTKTADASPHTKSFIPSSSHLPPVGGTVHARLPTHHTFLFGKHRMHAQRCCHVQIQIHTWTCTLPALGGTYTYTYTDTLLAGGWWGSTTRAPSLQFGAARCGHAIILPPASERSFTSVGRLHTYAQRAMRCHKSYAHTIQRVKQCALITILTRGNIDSATSRCGIARPLSSVCCAVPNTDVRPPVNKWPLINVGRACCSCTHKQQTLSLIHI